MEVLISHRYPPYKQKTKIMSNDYKIYFSDNLITDCAIGENGAVGFTLHIDDRDWDQDEIDEKGSIQYALRIYTDKPEKQQIKKSKLTNWYRLYCAYSQLPNDLFVYVDESGYVYQAGTEKGQREKNIAESLIPGKNLPEHLQNNPVTFSVFKLKTLFGHVWACGPRGNVAKRVGENAWEYKGHPFPDTLDVDELGKQVFLDIDGFSENDMYAIGQKSTVWHYDGSLWNNFDIPGNDLEFRTICCGEDGWIYIGTETGNIFKGKKNVWLMLPLCYPGCNYNDMVWFKDRIWITSSAGLWYIKDGHFEKLEYPKEIIQQAEQMAVSDEKLLVSGSYGAATFDGTDWNILF